MTTTDASLLAKYICQAAVEEGNLEIVAASTAQTIEAIAVTILSRIEREQLLALPFQC